jgi:hypothetical protein
MNNIITLEYTAVSKNMHTKKRAILSVSLSFMSDDIQLEDKKASRTEREVLGFIVNSRTLYSMVAFQHLFR